MKRVKIRVKGGRIFEGLLLPSEHPEVIKIKLKSGYNVAFARTNVEILEERQTEGKSRDTTTQNVPNAKIALLGCGGTIASKVDYTTGAVSPSISPQAIIEQLPSLKRFAPFSSRVIFQLLSEDMTPQHWTQIAQAVYEEVKDGKEGVILMHGTDTMHYSAAALAFAFGKPPIPIVFVGAQRSSDRPSSDNELNLLASFEFTQTGIKEVVVDKHNTIEDTEVVFWNATRVRKMHTSRRDAFKGIDSTPVAIFEKGEVKILTKEREGGTDFKPHFHDNVALLYIYPGIKANMFKVLSEYDGVVLAATGLGHLPINYNTDVYNCVKELINSDIPVVIAPQTLYGRINLNVYSTGRKLKDLGVIGNLMDWTPETAFVKLSWVLAQTKGIKHVKEMMETNRAGEITDRSLLF